MFYAIWKFCKEAAHVLKLYIHAIETSLNCISILGYNARDVIVKERLSGMYRLSAYYLAKITSESPVLFAYPTLYWTLIYFPTGLTIHPANFFMGLTAIYLVVFTVQVRLKK